MQASGSLALSSNRDDVVAERRTGCERVHNLEDISHSPAALSCAGAGSHRVRMGEHHDRSGESTPLRRLASWRGGQCRAGRPPRQQLVRHSVGKILLIPHLRHVRYAAVNGRKHHRQ